MTFANFIKSALEQTGLTKYKLAKRLGISQSTIANWENGLTEPRDKLRAEVFELFGVSETDLNSDKVIVHYKETPPTPEGEGRLSKEDAELFELIRSLPEDFRKREIAYLREYVNRSNTSSAHQEEEP